MYTATCFPAITVMVMVTCAILVFFFLTAVIWKRTREGARKNHREDFFADNVLRCARVREETMRGDPACDADIPSLGMGELCVNGTCLSARNVRDLLGLSGKIRSQNRMIEDEFRRVGHVLDDVKDAQEAKRKYAENMFDELQSKAGRVKTRISNAKAMLRVGQEDATIVDLGPTKLRDVATRDQMVGEFVLPKYYIFSYEIYIHGTVRNWGQIVRFNNTESASQNYPRPIAHWLTRRNTRIHAKASTTQSRNRGPNTGALSRNAWKRVEVQILPAFRHGRDHAYRIYIDGNLDHASESSHANLHGKMWVWIGANTGGRYTPANATVRNMMFRPPIPYGLGVLDAFASNKPKVAYAFRRLFRDYVGPQALIKRDSDSVSANVYLDAGGRVTLVHDENGEESKGLDQWLDGSDARVVTWYNQASDDNEYNASSRDGTKLEKYGGKYCLRFYQNTRRDEMSFGGSEFYANKRYYQHIKEQRTESVSSRGMLFGTNGPSSRSRAMHNGYRSDRSGVHIDHYGRPRPMPGKNLPRHSSHGPINAIGFLINDDEGRCYVGTSFNTGSTNKMRGSHGTPRIGGSYRNGDAYAGRVFEAFVWIDNLPDDHAVQKVQSTDL